MSLNHTSKYAELTVKHLEAIGKVVVEWSNIDFLLKIVLTRLLLCPDYPGRTFTDRLTAAKVQEALEEAMLLHAEQFDCRIISKQLLQEISEINRRITKLKSTRNKFAHLCWSRSTDEEIFGTNFSAGIAGTKKHKKSHIILKLTEINGFYAECYAIVEQLDKVIRKLPEMKLDGITKKLT